MMASGGLVPSRIGAEKLRVTGPDGKELSVGYDDTDGVSFTAKFGGGFNPNNPQHMFGSDAGRYAIALAEMRERKDFESFDSARDALTKFTRYRVEAGGDFVRVVVQTQDGIDARKKRKNQQRGARKIETEGK